MKSRGCGGDSALVAWTPAGYASYLAGTRGPNPSGKKPTGNVQEKKSAGPIMVPPPSPSAQQTITWRESFPENSPLLSGWLTSCRSTITLYCPFSAVQGQVTQQVSVSHPQRGTEVAAVTLSSRRGHPWVMIRSTYLNVWTSAPGALGGKHPRRPFPNCDTSVDPAG